uniref:Carboxypeptidase n=1 Tax=Populus trichocarpa TaxID=3694 RepID=A0A2K2AIT1_POPTR
MGRCWFDAVFIVVISFWLLVSDDVDGYPAEDLVLNLPGQPKVGFRQHAGYVDVDVRNVRSLFYYFLEAEKDPDQKPLALWLNGGPSCSSIGGGAFTELGPFFPRGDGRDLRRNSMSWNRAFNLLFVESLAGVGWSYSNTSSDYTIGDAKTAKDMHMFFLKLYDKFPEFKSRELFLTGESYAAYRRQHGTSSWSVFVKFLHYENCHVRHCIPQLAEVPLDHNAQSTDFKFNIKGVAIGNPLLRLNRDVLAKFKIFWSDGMIFDEIRLKIMNECDFYDYTFAINQELRLRKIICSFPLSLFISRYKFIFLILLSHLVFFKYTQATKMSVGVDVCMTYERRFYFNLLEVQKALYANRTKLLSPWFMCSNVLHYSDTNGNINILPILKKDHSKSYSSLGFQPFDHCSDDQDSIVPNPEGCSSTGSRTLVKELAQDVDFKITVSHETWFHKVRATAHMVPYAQPSRALHLFSSFVRGRRLLNTTHIPMDD